MGYDMTWTEEPADVKAAYAIIDGGQYTKEAFEKWWNVQSEAGSYYRLNIWGMGHMRRLLGEGGCLNTDPTPEYIEDVDKDYGGLIPLFKFCSNDGWLVSPTECITTAMTWFEGGGRQKARKEAKVIAAEDIGDGTESPEDVLRWADEFVNWIAGAASHGGFRVY